MSVIDLLAWQHICRERWRGGGQQCKSVLFTRAENVIEFLFNVSLVFCISTGGYHRKESNSGVSVLSKRFVTYFVFCITFCACAPYSYMNIFHSKIGQWGTKSLLILLCGKLSKFKCAKLDICFRFSVVGTLACDLQLTLFYMFNALLASMKYPYFIVSFHPQTYAGYRNFLIARHCLLLLIQSATFTMLNRQLVPILRHITLVLMICQH